VVIVTSATLDIQKMKKFFPKDTPHIQIMGRLFQVDIHYRNVTTESLVVKCVDLALEIHKSKRIDKQSNKNRKIGDILVFLPG
jgi:HrpA-like RNA helicase